MLPPHVDTFWADNKKQIIQSLKKSLALDSNKYTSTFEKDCWNPDLKRETNEKQVGNSLENSTNRPPYDCVINRFIHVLQMCHLRVTFGYLSAWAIFGAVIYTVHYWRWASLFIISHNISKPQSHNTIHNWASNWASSPPSIARCINHTTKDSQPH